MPGWIITHTTPPPPPLTFTTDSYARLLVSIVSQITKPLSFSARTGIHELYILLAKPFEIPNQRDKSLNSKLNISFINTRSNWSATSSWKENVFSIFISLTKVKNISFVTTVYNKESQSVTILPFADIVPVSVITWTPFSSMESIFVSVIVNVVWFRVCVIISSQKVGIFVLCFLALTLDGSRTLNSQIASGRYSVLCPEDVETVSPEYIPAPLSSCISFLFLLSGSCLISFRRPGVVFFSYPSLSCGIGFLSVGFPSKQISEQTNICLGRDFLLKAFAHCNRIDSLEGIVCSLYGIIQEQSSRFCLCNSQKIRFHSFNLRLLFEQPLPAHDLPPTF